MDILNLTDQIVSKQTVLINNLLVENKYAPHIIDWKNIAIYDVPGFKSAGQIDEEVRE